MGRLLSSLAVNRALWNYWLIRIHLTESLYTVKPFIGDVEKTEQRGKIRNFIVIYFRIIRLERERHFHRSAFVGVQREFGPIFLRIEFNSSILNTIMNWNHSRRSKWRGTREQLTKAYESKENRDQTIRKLMPFIDLIRKIPYRQKEFPFIPWYILLQVSFILNEQKHYKWMKNICAAEYFQSFRRHQTYHLCQFNKCHSFQFRRADC